MTTRLTPPAWDKYDPNMLINVADMKYYFETYTDAVSSNTVNNKLAIDTLDGRVSAIEHQIPVGPGGTGAYLNLGGTPDRYPTAEEMAEGGNETSFMVVARTDGIYFYNPVTKLLIKPKKGGGTVAVHGQLPMIYDESHQLQHNGRASVSGVYTAKCSDVGLDSWTSHDMCKILVVSTGKEEYQTAMHPDGFASRIFREGEVDSTWGFITGGSGGGGSVDPTVVNEINRRLGLLESVDHVEDFFDLKDVVADSVTDANGLLYIGEDGKIRGGKTNPLLSMGYTHTHVNSVGTPSALPLGNVGATIVASTSVVILKEITTKILTLPAVVQYNASELSTTQVREGRTTFIVNMSPVVQTVRLSPSHMFYVEGGMTNARADIPPKTVFVYNPAIISNDLGVLTPCWVYMGNYQLQSSDTSTIFAEINQLKLDLLSLGADFEVVKNKPNPKFTELLDTPTGYHPGKLLGYNLAGDGFSPVDPINNFRAMTDTPSSYAGQARKTIVVKTDESGLEFATLPNLTPLQNDVNNIYNTVVRLENEQIIQNRDIITNRDNHASYRADLEGGKTTINPNIVCHRKYQNTSDLSAAAVAGRPHIFASGAGSDLKINLPDIYSPSDSVSISSVQVYEGRITYLYNQGTQPREIVLFAGNRFNIAGTVTNAPQIINPGTMHAYFPGIQGDGVTKQWDLLYKMQMNPSI